MSKNLKHCIKELQYVSNIKCNKTKQVMLKYISENMKIYLALREIAVNLIKGNINIDNKTKFKLRKHKNSIINLANKKRLTKSKRKKLIVQSRGWMWIIPLVTSIIELIK